MGLVICNNGCSNKNCEGDFNGLQKITPSVSKDCNEIDYAPFITDGLVTLPDQQSGVPVRILRDTGAAQSFLLAGVLPLSEQSATGTHVLVRRFFLLPLYNPSLLLQTPSNTCLLTVWVLCSGQKLDIVFY